MSFMKKITKNKVKLLLAVVIVLAVTLVVSMIVFFTDNSSKPGYGNRLDGIKEVEISKSEQEEMKTKLEKETNVSSVSSNIQGKIVNVIIKVKTGVKVSDAKKLASKVIDCYGKDQVSFYDFQVFIESEDSKNTSYPIIGYKKASADEFSFTKNRGDA